MKQVNQTGSKIRKYIYNLVWFEIYSETYCPAPQICAGLVSELEHGFWIWYEVYFLMPHTRPGWLQDSGLNLIWNTLPDYMYWPGGFQDSDDSILILDFMIWSMLSNAKAGSRRPPDMIRSILPDATTGSRRPLSLDILWSILPGVIANIR